MKKNKLLSLSRIIRTGAVNFSRNLSLAAAAMAVMVVTLTIILFSIIASATFNNTVAQITSKINISVYLNNKITTSQRQDLMAGLRNLPNVKSLNYVSKNQALAEYKSENAGNSNLLQAVSEAGNPLPASIQVTPKDTSKIQGIKNFVDQSQYKNLQDPQAGTSYSGARKTAINKISHAANILKEVGVIGVIVFALISVLIIFNTIRMAIFNRRDEINIMRLLGASTSFIRGPFVVESLIYGIIAALVSTAIVYILFVGSSSALQASSLGLLNIGYANHFFKSHFWVLLTLQIAIGILIGAASSIIATRRYLKLKTSK
ncbi:MAG: cell division protein FtsX [Candidatus Saccharimonadales bacterium]